MGFFLSKVAELRCNLLPTKLLEDSATAVSWYLLEQLFFKVALSESFQKNYRTLQTVFQLVDFSFVKINTTVSWQL